MFADGSGRIGVQGVVVGGGDVGGAGRRPLTPLDEPAESLRASLCSLRLIKKWPMTSFFALSRTYSWSSDRSTTMEVIATPGEVRERPNRTHC